MTNSPPSFFLPATLAEESSELFAWIQRSCLRMEKSEARQGWYVWMPLEAEEKRG